MFDYRMVSYRGFIMGTNINQRSSQPIKADMPKQNGFASDIGKQQ